MDAPIKVAVCPPLALGGTPSIWGYAQSHFLSSSIQVKQLCVLTDYFAFLVGWGIAAIDSSKGVMLLVVLLLLLLVLLLLVLEFLFL